jgi:hypothetical protein
MPIRPRRIVADMLLMPARQIGNPIALLIQMVVNDPTGSALGLRVQYATCTYCTLFMGGVPKCTQKTECARVCGSGQIAGRGRKKIRVDCTTR